MIFVKRRLIFFVALLFLLPSCFLKAQFHAVEVFPSANVEMVDETYYFLHTVKAGHTLYSIARAYTITQELIVDINPELEYGLKADQVIKIPAFSHIVIPGDTEYALSRKYGLSIEQLRAFNPVLSDGLKLGQQLFVPGRMPEALVQQDKDPGVILVPPDTPRLPEWPRDTPQPPIAVDSDEFLHRKDLPALDSLTRKIFGSIQPCMFGSPKETYHVALLIPLFLNEFPSTLNQDSLRAGMIQGFSERHNSFSFISYYHGVLLAVDSLQAQGIDIRLHVYDVDQNEQTARQAVSSAGFSMIDLIIGPFYSNTLNYVSNYALHNNIPVVSPLLPDKQKLRGFPNLFNAIPSLEIQLENLAEYIGDNYFGQNIIFVHNNQPQALPVIAGFKRTLNNSLRSKHERHLPAVQANMRHVVTQNPAAEPDSVVAGPPTFKEVIYDRVGINGLLAKMDQNKKNIVVTLISGEAFLSNYLRELNIHTRRYDMEVFGIPDWKDYESIEIDYLQNLNVHIFSPHFVAYSEPHIKDFIRRYRKEFNTEPSPDAFKAVNTAYFFFSALALFGKTFPECMPQLNSLPSQFPFHFQKPYGQDHGWENAHTTLFKHEDFKLVDVNK